RRRCAIIYPSKRGNKRKKRIARRGNSKNMALMSYAPERDYRNIIALRKRAGKRAYARVNFPNNLLCASIGSRANRLLQTLHPKERVSRIRRFGYAVRIKHQNITAFQSQCMDIVHVAKGNGKGAIADGEQFETLRAGAPKQGRIMPRIDIRETPTLWIQNPKKRGNKHSRRRIFGQSIVGPRKNRYGAAASAGARAQGRTHIRHKQSRVQPFARHIRNHKGKPFTAERNEIV